MIRLLWIALSLILVIPQASASGLSEAYKKEFAFLEAEKRALQSRLRELKADRSSRAAKAEREITALQNGLFASNENIAGLEEELSRLDQKKNDGGEDLLRVRETLKRATDRLAEMGTEGLSVPGEDAQPEELAQAIASVFQHGLDHLKLSQQIRTTSGAFFTPDGTRVEGEILHFGHVARFGSAGSTQGALAPAGGGEWKIWPASNGATAGALVANQAPTEGLEIFLVDSPDKAVEPKVEKTALMIIEAGGVIAWVIVGLGTVAMFLALLRLLGLLYHTLGGGTLAEKTAQLVSDGQFEEARNRLSGNRLALSPVLRSLVVDPHADREELENRLSEALLKQSPRLTRFGSAMTVIAAVAPLMGLLGTVTGMISTFDVITEHGTGDPRMLSGGISEALITTELGLIVAIPTLILGTLLTTWAKQNMGRLEYSALHVLNHRPVEVPAGAQGENSEA